jgi:outer membrane receptor protein involved in Fe transport
VNQTFISNQPLNGRSFQTLIGMSPGIVFTPSNVVTGGQFSVNGQRSSSNYFMVDGVSANFGLPLSQNLYDAVGGSVPSLSAQGSTSALASVDSVEEFAVQTSAFAPEYGRTPGAQVTIVTRSGTNDLHGSAFDYLRNDKLDANNWFANRNSAPRPPLRQNDLGFALGGPVWVPHYNGRNKTFFFASYEGLRLRQPQVSNPVVVPSLAARDRGTGDIRSILNAYPLPNRPALAIDPNSAIFIGTYSNPSNLDATSVRIDHSFGRLSVFGRYHNSPSTVRPRNISNPVVLDSNVLNSETVTLGATAVLSPRIMNDLRMNFSRSRAELVSDSDDFGGAVPLPASVAFPPFASPVKEKARIAVATSSILVYGPNQDNRQRQWNIVETFTTIQGSHTMKFGFDYRRMAPINQVPPFQRNVNFNNFTQVLSGVAASVSLFRMELTLFPVLNNYSLFVQDTWRIKHRLTVTYGLRWDVNPSPSEQNGHLLPTVRGLNSPATANLAPAGARLYNTTYGNLAPRLGIAYHLSERRGTLLRGGVGVYYDLGYVFAGSASPSAYPFGNSATYTNLPLTAPEYSSNVAPVVLQPPYGALFAYEEGYKLPYTLQLNVSLEQPVAKDNIFSATYVGAIGRRLGRVEVLSNPAAGLNRDFTRINLVRNSASSDYHALQLQFRRRLTTGLQALASYAFSKSLDIVSDESIINYQAPLARYDPSLDRGPSSFDARHNFTGTISYDLPAPRVWRPVFGGFGIDTIVRAQSAIPVNILTNTAPSVSA